MARRPVRRENSVGARWFVVGRGQQRNRDTPARRDVLAEFFGAFRDEGLRVGLYYSLIDWHHPEFPLDGLHPSWSASADNSSRPIDRYVEYMRGQLRELIERFAPDVLWFDFSYPGNRLVANGKGRDDWQSEKLVSMVRELAPNTLINDPLDLPGGEDFITSEEVSPHEQPVVAGKPVAWEACRTLNGSWGYARGSNNG